MIKINRKVEYALMVLMSMKNKGNSDLTTAREVCDAFHCPFDTTAKVMQQMNTAGILQSHKGVKGGYTLSKDLNTLSYLDLAELIEGKSFIMDCHHMDGPQKPCEMMNSCNIALPIRRLNDYLMMIFNSLTIGEILSDDNLLALKILPLKKVENCPLTKATV